MKLFKEGLAVTSGCIEELNAAQAQIDSLKGELDLILGRADGKTNE